MSQERVTTTLMSFGLTRMDAQTYILLAKRGPQIALEVGKALKMSKQQLYRSLKSLENRGMVSATLDHPAKFSAETFERALDLLAKAKMKKALEETQHIQETKDELLADWQSLSTGEYDAASPKFVVIKGRNNIYAKIQQMITETRAQISTMTTVPSLMRADQFGLFDVDFQRPQKSKIRFRFLTELSEHNLSQIKTLLDQSTQAGLIFEGRNPDLGLRPFPRMVIRDEDEIMFFIKSSPIASGTEQDNSCIWTNCKDLVRAFRGIFEQLWQNSTNIQAKIEEIETVQSARSKSAVGDVETATPDYIETLSSAKKEVLMMTSSKGLVGSLANITRLRERTKGGISIRIMAPITSENLEMVQQLSGFCQIRHIPRSALGTTIIDGKDLFQFTNLPDQENLEIAPRSENIYYTSDQKYVERMKSILNNIWKTASSPSAMTLDSVLMSSTVMGAASAFEMTAVESVRKNDQAKLSARRGFKGKVTMGMAAIHPPSCLNLLDMMIHVQKSTKESDFGASDTVIFYLCLRPPEFDTSHDMPGGFSAYVPLAIINNNPRSAMMLKALYVGSPAAQNIILAGPQQLEVWQQNNTLFAGWTIPISLLPPKYSLPPSCILFEGIGEAKHKTGTGNWPSGYKSTTEYDEVEAFVTFINPSSKYSGPGTDGRLRTNLAAVTTPR